MNRFRRTSARVPFGASALALVLGLLMAVPGVASAADRTPNTRAPVTLDDARARCTKGLDERLQQLGELEKRLDGSAVDAGTKASLQAELQGARDGLTALRPALASAPDLATLTATCRKVATDYRVYALEDPTVRLTIASARQQANADKASEIIGKVRGRLAGGSTTPNGSKTKADDPAKAEQLLADSEANIAQAKALSAGIPTTVIPITPATFNDGSGRPALRDALKRATDAHAHLRAAQRDLEQVRKLLHD